MKSSETSCILANISDLLAGILFIFFDSNAICNTCISYTLLALNKSVKNYIFIDISQIWPP